MRTPSVKWAECFYASFTLRAVPVNINYRYVEKELRHLYDNSDAVAVIVTPEFVANVGDGRGICCWSQTNYEIAFVCGLSHSARVGGRPLAPSVA